MHTLAPVEAGEQVCKGDTEGTSPSSRDWRDSGIKHLPHARAPGPSPPRATWNSDAHPRQSQHSSVASLNGGTSWVPQTAAQPLPWQAGGVGYLPSVCTKWPPGQPHQGHQLLQLKVPGPQAGQAELRLWSTWGEQGQHPKIFKYCSSSLHRGHCMTRGRERSPTWNAVEREATEDKTIKQSRMW